MKRTLIHLAYVYPHANITTFVDMNLALHVSTHLSTFEQAACLIKLATYCCHDDQKSYKLSNNPGVAYSDSSYLSDWV